MPPLHATTRAKHISSCLWGKKQTNWFAHLRVLSRNQRLRIYYQLLKSEGHFGLLTEHASGYAYIDKLGKKYTTPILSSMLVDCTDFFHSDKNGLSMYVAYQYLKSRYGKIHKNLSLAWQLVNANWYVTLERNSFLKFKSCPI